MRLINVVTFKMFNFTKYYKSYYFYSYYIHKSYTEVETRSLTYVDEMLKQSFSHNKL